MDNLSSNAPQSNPRMRKMSNSTKVTLYCSFCNKTYCVKKSHEFRSKYCSKECRNTSDRNGETKQCLHCKKDIYATPSSQRKFCSLECRDAYKIGPNSHNYKGNFVDCICLFCGSSFQNPESWVKRNRGKFCSTTCRSRHTIEKQGGMVSSIEIAVKEVLEDLGENYHHQHRIERFLVDFYLPNRNLVIEVDGDYWHSLERSIKNDAKKDQYMQENQINIARLKESDIKSHCHRLVTDTLDQFPLIEASLHDVSTKNQDVITQRRFEW